jgi:hypothetical protein
MILLDTKPLSAALNEKDVEDVVETVCKVVGERK